MRKLNNYSAQYNISEQSNQSHAKNNNPIPKMKLSKRNQEFINKISASGFEQFNL